ncbi:MAG: hypothetical protein H7Z40_17170 [Phycisphaerae bacterium]|nr:hypothetical protein [Gemmatimonadaceae bacterium]
MSERRYSDVEVAAIFEQATRVHSGEPSQLTSAAGMTLAQLQDIGREVGIEPAIIAQAARTVGSSMPTSSRTFLGLPIGVGRIVQLDRKMPDEEWERLVVDLRETFEARGVVRREGSLRQWTNGNLQVLVEPTETGDRIRMRTAKSDVRGFVFAGSTMLGLSALGLTVAALRGGTGDIGSLVALTVVAAGGALMLGLGTIRVPAWARLRRQQMEDLATKISSASGR